MCISTAWFVWVCSLPVCQWANGWYVDCTHSIKFSSLRQHQWHPYCQPEVAAFRLHLNIICYKCWLASAAGLTNNILEKCVVENSQFPILGTSPCKNYLQAHQFTSSSLDLWLWHKSPFEAVGKQHLRNVIMYCRIQTTQKKSKVVWYFLKHLTQAKKQINKMIAVFLLLQKIQIYLKTTTAAKDAISHWPLREIMGSFPSTLVGIKK